MHTVLHLELSTNDINALDVVTEALATLTDIRDRLVAKRAATPALVATPSDPILTDADPVPAPAFATDGDILDFLQSDDRYSKRTAASVAKNFGIDEGAAGDRLNELVDSGRVVRTTRRRDGVYLYEAA